MADDKAGPQKDTKSKNRLPQATKTKLPTKPPKGSRSNPWYKVPEHTDKKTGKVYPACYLHYGKDGIWKVPQLPSSYPVQVETSY